MPRRTKDTTVIRLPRRKRTSRVIVGRVRAQLPVIDWTDDRIKQTASLLADLLVSDLQQYPISQSQKAS